MRSYSSALLWSSVHRYESAACSSEQAARTFVGSFAASSVIIVIIIAIIKLISVVASNPSGCRVVYHLYFLPIARLILDLDERSMAPP